MEQRQEVERGDYGDEIYYEDEEEEDNGGTKVKRRLRIGHDRKIVE